MTFLSYDAYRLAAPSGTDDSAAFIAACAQTTYRKIQMGRGTYITDTMPDFSNHCLMGEGTETTLKVKNSSTIAAAFHAPASAANIEFRDFIFDANSPNRTGGVGTYGQLIDMARGSGVKNLVVENVEFDNTFGTTGALAPTCDGVVITRCKFRAAKDCHIRLDGCTNFKVSDNEFTDWGSAASGVRSSIMLFDNATADGEIVNNRWKNTRATYFCIESVPTTPGAGVYHKRVNITGNRMDAGGYAGSGVSGYFADSNISGNILANGADAAGSSFLQRNGIEVFGSRCVISGNILANGSISISADIASGYASGYGNIVSNNVLNIIAANQTAMQIINIEDQLQFDVSHNELNIAGSGSATITAGIYVGTYSTPGVAKYGKVSHNTLTQTGLAGAAAGSGIRLATGGTYGTDVEICDNIVQGFNYGLFLPSTANDVNMTFARNNLWNNANVIQGTATGGGNLFSYNRKVNTTAPIAGA